MISWMEKVHYPSLMVLYTKVNGKMVNRQIWKRRNEDDPENIERVNNICKDNNEKQKP